MDELSPVTRALAEHLLGSSRDVIVFALVFAAVGLALGIALAVAARRGGWLRREPRAWGWAARLQYAYVPLLLMAFGGAMGGVHGAHRGVGHAIDEASGQAVDYARAWLPALQDSLNASLGRAAGSGVTVETLVAEQMQGRQRVANPFARRALYHLNLAIVHHAMNQVNVPADLRAPVSALRHVDLTRLDQRAYELLPRTLHAAANQFFFSQYLLVLLAFLPFLLVPPAERLAYAWYQRRRRRADAHPAA